MEERMGNVNKWVERLGEGKGSSLAKIIVASSLQAHLANLSNHHFYLCPFLQFDL